MSASLPLSHLLLDHVRDGATEISAIHALENDATVLGRYELLVVDHIVADDVLLNCVRFTLYQLLCALA